MYLAASKCSITLIFKHSTKRTRSLNYRHSKAKKRSKYPTVNIPMVLNLYHWMIRPERQNVLKLLWNRLQYCAASIVAIAYHIKIHAIVYNTNVPTVNNSMMACTAPINR